MRLHENRDLFSDALQAASQPVEDGGLGIKSIFIEKDYWICRSLSLMAANDKDNRAIFKGGTSLTKAYGIGSRFSEDIDIAISEAWTLSGNQLKMLIKRTAKSMTKGLQEMDMPGFTSKGSHYHKAYYSYPRAIDTLQVGAIKAGQLLVEIFSNLFAQDQQRFDKPEGWQNKDIMDSPIISDLHNVWSVLSNVYAKELPDLAYKDIPTIESIENSMEQLISYLPKYSIVMTRKVKL